MKTLKDAPEAVRFVDSVHQFIVLSGMTSTRLAKSAGISPSTLSQLLSHKYPGVYENIRPKIQAVMDREQEKSKLKKTNPNFIETSISKRFFDIAKMAHMFCEIGVCYSFAGLGKTESAREYARTNDDCILLEALPSYRARIMLQDLHSRLYNDAKKDLNTTFRDCVERLRDSGRLLIIDEAEKLSYTALEYVRRLHDFTGIGILLCGMPELLGNLRGNRGQFAQLYSRSGMAVKLESLLESDTKTIVSKMAPEADDHYRIYHKECAGNTRRLIKIINRSVYLANLNDSAIDTEIIQAASKLVKVEMMS